MSKVSVLVAVYNAADYIDRCINSLLSQTYADIQILCTDDGSTDGSLSLLRNFAERDSRVEVIVLERNYGAHHARNEGLKRAVGDYVMFLDSDDWLSKDAIEKAIEVFATDEETDCVLFDVVKYYQGTGKEEPYIMPYHEAITGREAFEASLTWKIHGVYMVKADIHRQCPYDESCRAYSDDNTTRIHYLRSRKVGFCMGKYYYFQHSRSVTHNVSMLRFEHIKANESMKRQLIDMKMDDFIVAEHENARWLVLIDTYMFYFKHRRELAKRDRKQALAEMRRIWNGIETDKIETSLKHKFGYCPTPHCWLLFRLQEEAYFSLKTMLGR